VDNIAYKPQPFYIRLIMLTRYALLFLMFEWSANGQISSTNEDAHINDTIQKHQREIAQTCGAAMTNILNDVRELAQQYSPLSNIGSTSIESRGSSESGNWHLEYSKNAHFVMFPSPAPGGLNRGGPSGETVIDSDGSVLEIGILNFDDNSGMSPIDHSGGGYYPLLMEGVRPVFELIYNFKLNKPNQILEQSVRNIVEKNVALLRSKLRTILGVSPEKERSELLAPVMTNILSKLEEIEPQYPLLTNINSATIDNKDTNYIYQHLRYWKKAGGPTEGSNSTNQRVALDVNPVVERGGMALDVYLLSRDEPFGFDPYGYSLFMENGNPKVVLKYSIYFSRADEGYNTAERAAVVSTRRAIDKIIEDEEQQVRKMLDNMISF
jgi:hypothetical protein